MIDQHTPSNRLKSNLEGCHWGDFTPIFARELSIVSNTVLECFSFKDMESTLIGELLILFCKSHHCLLSHLFTTRMCASNCQIN